MAQCIYIEAKALKYNTGIEKTTDKIKCYHFPLDSVFTIEDGCLKVYNGDHYFKIELKYITYLFCKCDPFIYKTLEDAVNKIQEEKKNE